MLDRGARHLARIDTDDRRSFSAEGRSASSVQSASAMSMRRKMGAMVKVERFLTRYVFDRHQDDSGWIELPSIPVIAARVGVSINVVREVVHGFVSLGLVHFEQGRFVVVPVELTGGAQTVALRLRCASTREEHAQAQHAWFALARTTMRAALPLAVPNDHALREKFATAGDHLSATWGLSLTRPSEKVYAIYDFIFSACETSDDRGALQLAKTLWDGLGDLLPFAGQVVPMQELDDFARLFQQDFPQRRHEKITARFERVLASWEEATTKYTRENDDPRQARSRSWDAVQREEITA